MKTVNGRYSFSLSVCSFFANSLSLSANSLLHDSRSRASRAFASISSSDFGFFLLNSPVKCQISI